MRVVLLLLVVAVVALLVLRTMGRRAVGGLGEQLRAGAAAGDPNALRALAVQAKRSGDLDEAERLLREGAAAGDPNCMFGLGRLVEERDGLEASEQWFRMAAEHGNYPARTAFEPGGVFNFDGSKPTPVWPREGTGG